MQTPKVLLLAVAATSLLCGGAFAAQSDVVDLDPTSFPKMLKSDRLWMVEFYGGLWWCVDNVTQHLHHSARHGSASHPSRLSQQYFTSPSLLSHPSFLFTAQPATLHGSS